VNEIKKTIADNVDRVRERIDRAATAAGRSAAEVQLVAVSKYVDAQTSAALIEAGCASLGESRPQQLWEKAGEAKLERVSWHMIGHLQRNKVRRTLPLVDLIHSVDSKRLLKTINDEAAAQDRRVRVLLEVNASGDESKNGLVASELEALLPELSDFSKVDVCGLMTMAAREGGEAVARQNFASLRTLRDKVADDCPPGTVLTELSMGMSHDFESAILEGATLVRIGSLLFHGIR